VKSAAYLAGLAGLALLTVLVVHTNLPGLLHTWQLASPVLLWLVPYRLIFFVLYAIGWRAMLRPFDPGGRAGFGYVLLATMVREGVDRLLPVASLGGSVVGVRVMRWRGLAMAPVGATIIAEIVLTLIAVYALGALATLILLGSQPGDHHAVVTVLALTLPVPVVSLLLLRYGSVFQRLQRFLQPMVGLTGAGMARSLDADLRGCLSRVRTLVLAAVLEFLALLSAAFEIWWALRLFQHPVSASAAIMLEGMTQAARHLAFIVPAGLGVQEAALVLFGQALGIGSEVALAVSAVKRAREVLCGLPPLLWWQLQEARRVRALRS